MKIEKKEFASWGDGKLVKTVAITLIPEDDHDKRIIGQRLAKKESDTVYICEQ
ncbi:MAG: hypothetical protein KAS36_03875 [Anaerolineales bacterium]|nr:hypothetical protein [Anaerolineales bacterium]